MTKFRPASLNRVALLHFKKQRGVVLVIALIVLIVMTLAGLGMMRSVDTGALVAGNIAFKQVTIQGGDRAIDDGYSVLMHIIATAKANPSDKNILDYSDGRPCPTGVSAYLCTTNLLGGSVVDLPGYSSAVINQCEIDNTCTTAAQKQWWADASNWTGAAPVVVETDANGNQVASVSYLIHRMCAKANIATNPTDGSTNLCQTFDEGVATGDCNGCSKKVGADQFPTRSVFYRITARSIGPRNTVTYSQALVLLPE